MTTRTKPRFELVASKCGRRSFTLTGVHGEMLLIGRVRETLSAVIDDINQVMTYGGHEGCYTTSKGSGDHFWFVLTSPKGAKLGVGNLYHSSQGRDNAIIQVRRAIQCYMPTYLN